VAEVIMAKPSLVGQVADLGNRLENGLSAFALLLMAGLPVIEIVLRALFNTGVPGTFGYVQHLTLWVAFLGAMIASREKRHISLSTGAALLPPRPKAIADTAVAVICTFVAAGLSWASVQFIRTETLSPERLGGWLPVWAAEIILPIAFAIIGLRFVSQAGGPASRAVALLGIPALAAIGYVLAPYSDQLVWPVVAALIVAALLGAPIFVLLGGAALILFVSDAVPIAAIPVEIYRIVVSPSIPAIPLFTLTGYLLAEGRSSTRLVRLFRAVFGWMPGGLVLSTTLVCAFFSTFTGASGVTIIALGGVLLPVLTQNGLRERFSIGLITSTGSIGLLFPPSLAVILYGVIARIPINELFIAGLVPGLLMVAAVSLYGLRESLRGTSPRPPFDLREMLAAIWAAKWEILLPVVALVAIFGGFTSLIEAASLTVVYALVMQTLIHRDLNVTSDIPRILVKSVTLIGGVFAILGVAMGFTNYLVDAMVPMKAAAWVQQFIDSKIAFLLMLNIFLLIVGGLMDIFSAIIVVVPLLLPIARAFGVEPLHLAIIFLVNLELGYLTPPVGMNLFLSALRFDQKLADVYRSTLPFFFVLLTIVLLVTYVPTLIIGVG
jgi:tripartite ATP-independent transporter DctM subunit